MLDPNDPIAQIKRHARMRKSILRLIDAAKVNEWMPGRKLADIVENLPPGLESEMELLALCQDLIHLGLIESTDLRKTKSDGKGLDYLAYRVTGKGTGLLAGTEPVCGLVEDERIG